VSRGEDRSPSTIILQRLQAEEALREMDSEKLRSRFSHGVRTVWNGRRFLLGLSLIAFVVAVLGSFLIPVRYTASAHLMPSDTQSGSSLALAAMAASRGAGGFGQIASDLIGSKSNSDVFVGILESRNIQNQIIQQFDLKRVYDCKRLVDARRALEKHVEISIDRKDQFITVAVTDGIPERAEAITKAYVSELNRLVSDFSSSSAHRERLFLEDRLSQVNRDLESAEKDFSQFASKNNAVDIGQQEKAMFEAAAAVQGQLMEARSGLEGLRQIYSDSSSRVRSERARIEELQSQLEKLGGKTVAGTPPAESEASSLYPSIRKLPLLGVTYADLYRRTRVQEAVFESLTQEYEFAKVQEARETPTVKVLDVPEVPERRSSPPSRIVIGTAFTCVAFLGGVTFLLVSGNVGRTDSRGSESNVMTDIWIDLKEKRFLGPQNGSAFQRESTARWFSRERVFAFFGLNFQRTKPDASLTAAPQYESEESFAEKS
jgi:uncharacterized protein involved in exopolysaccharide biosynthesis